MESVCLSSELFHLSLFITNLRLHTITKLKKNHLDGTLTNFLAFYISSIKHLSYAVI